MKTIDLTRLNWATNPRGTKGTAGTFLKSEEEKDGAKLYYKLSQYNKVSKVYGHESILEVVAYSFIKALGLSCVKYDLIRGLVRVDEEEFETYLCASEEFKKKGETKIDLDIFYETHKVKGETAATFCHRLGFEREINELVLVDFLIASRDRHGANIEILKSPNGDLRLAPLFDNGVSLTSPYYTEEDLARFDFKSDITANNFIGTHSLKDNLKLITNPVFVNAVNEETIDNILNEFNGVLSDVYIKTIKSMLLWRLNYAKERGFLKFR